MPDQDALINAIEAYESQSYGSEGEGGELSRQRALALDAYAGKNIEPGPEGRSQVVSWDVFEAVQWILPSLTRIFAGGDDVVEFDPTSAEDEEAAAQESQVLNYLVTQKGNWFMTCLQWFQDALITKNAYCLCELQERIVPEIERYEGQSEEQVAMLLEDDVEIVGQEQYDDPDDDGQLVDPSSGQPVQDEATALGAMAMYAEAGMEPQMVYRQLFNVEVKRVKPKQELKFRVLPPERVLVGEDTETFQIDDSCNFFCYTDRMTISDLRKMGYDVDDEVGAEDAGSYDSVEDTARDDIFMQRFGTTDLPDPALRQVRVRTAWIRYDYDEDGIAELQKVVIVGRNVLDHEPASRIPVASIVPFINTHRHVGISVADLTFDIQRIKTALLRSGLDSMYLAVNPRHAVDERSTNLNDLLVARPGGIVRTDGPPQNAIMPLQTENTFPHAQLGLQHMDTVIESRVGVNRMFQGIDQNALSSTNAHNAIGQLSTMAAQRVEQIARIFANGVERLFSLAHEAVLRSGHRMDAIRIRGQWVEIDPTTWRTGRDMRVVAPFAAGNKDSLLQRLMVIAQLQEKAAMAGLPIVDLDDMYNLAKEIANAADLPADKFFTDPATVEPQPPGPDHTMIALEIENKKAENQARDTQVDAEVDRYKTDVSAEVDKYRADLSAQTQVYLAQIKAGQQVDLEQMKANLKNVPVELGNEAIKATGGAVEQLSSQVSDSIRQISEAIEQMKSDAEAEIEIVRDEKGKITGKRVNGKFIGLKDAK